MSTAMKTIGVRELTRLDAERAAARMFPFAAMAAEQRLALTAKWFREMADELAKVMCADGDRDGEALIYLQKSHIGLEWRIEALSLWEKATGARWDRKSERWMVPVLAKVEGGSAKSEVAA